MIKPIKHFGQNFLIDKTVVKKVIKASDLNLQDIVLEIGPGMGALTEQIAKKARKVIAIEKDDRMCRFLREKFKDFKNIEIINKDILKFNNYSLPTTHYKLISNLPFYITAPVIRKFLESKNPPKEMILIIQKEVAQRICSKPGKMSILAVSVQFYSDVKTLSYISKRAFSPKPKVDSAIIKIKPKGYKVNKKFFKLVKAGFSQPRKQLINNLSKQLKINKEKISSLLLSKKIKPTQRAESLTINNWIDLLKVL